MGTDDLHHKRKRIGNYDRGSVGKRELREKFLIICEGERTEPNYFKAFPVKSDVVKLDIYGEGKNTLSLVREAVKLKEAAAARKEPYVQVWCVFDKDSFSDEQFNQAITLCTEKHINLAYSNEAFELWYLLHFAYIDTALSRDQYGEKLTACLGRKYHKEDPGMYSSLKELGNEVLAIRCAKQLRRYHFKNDGAHIPSRQNPSTTVYELVEILNQYIEET